MSFFCKAVVYLLLALPAVAHSQAFPKITIRPASSADPRNMRMQVLPNGDLIANAVPVIMLLSYAYDVPVDPSPRLSPLPDWTIRERYDIEGKGTANPITPSLQGSDSRSRIQQKIRGLLADRFRLAMRVENKTMSVYGIVRQRIDDVKTDESRKAITVTQTMIEALKLWKQTTQFSAQEDWIFASPAQLGRLPWSADSVNDAYKKAASAAKVAHVNTHSMRHTYRSWLYAVGTPIAVQQKLMRHADIRTTMNGYVDVVTDEMSRAASKVARLALNGSQTDHTPS
jgi:hypothetical protein